MPPLSLGMPRSRGRAAAAARRSSALGLLLACAPLAACMRPPSAEPDEPGSPSSAEGAGLAVRAVPAALELTNRDATPIYYMLFERRVSALVNWRPCHQPGVCPEVPAGARRRVPYDSIMGYGPDAAEVILYWWHITPSPAGGRGTVDSERSTIVPLRNPAPG